MESQNISSTKKKAIKQIIYFFWGLFTCELYAQDVLWEQSIGGNHSEYLFDVISTVDYGFVLAGSSLSDKTGRKENTNNGQLDYFLWKMDKNGKKEWELNFGGNKNDYLISINKTSDSGYILGGYSDSGIGGDKKTVSYGGNDLWIIKLNAEGIQEWQKSYGGRNDDKIVKVKQTKDKGFIIIANSNSDKSENKSENNRGNFDYWIIKLDKNGNKLWDKTIGGEYNDFVKDIIELDQGFLILGNSNSNLSGDKESNANGGYDSWVIKIDKRGVIIDQWLIGGNEDDLYEIILYQDKLFYLFGTTNSTNGGTVIESAKLLKDFSMLILDNDLEIKQQINYDFNGDEILKSAYFIENEIVISGIYRDLENKKNSFLTMNIDKEGNMLKHFILESNSNDILAKSIMTREGGLVLAGSSSGKVSKAKNKEIGRSDFWIVKFGELNEQINKKETILEAFPNPTEGYTNIVLNHEYKEGKIYVFDMSGKLLYSNVLKYDMITVDLSKYTSGVYLIKIITDVIDQSIKVLKK